MSIMNGEVVLDGEMSRGGNRNYNKPAKHQNRNKKFKQRERRSYDDGYYAFGRSSYLPEDMRGNNEEYPFDEENCNETDERADEINAFCDEFTDNIQNYRNLQEIIAEQFPSVVGYTKLYYGSKNKPVFVDALNRLIKTISTTPFANTLGTVLESGFWDDGTYDNIWTSIAFSLSVALETSYDRMHTDVVRKYASSILPRMWKPEISDITIRTGITKDLALDLFIAIPIVDTEWNSANIDAFYHRFLDKMIIHAEDNMDILNWEIQGVLYDKMFGKGKTALKVIGKYLVSADELKNLDSDVATSVYAEFKKMLYSKLDRYDIREIEYVLKFVAKYIEDHQEMMNKTIFSSVAAAKRENVRKALLSVMDNNHEAMKYLA